VHAAAVLEALYKKILGLVGFKSKTFKTMAQNVFLLQLIKSPD
jgi:hypothetical protein